MKKLKKYYKNIYSKKQLQADLGRKNQLKFLFTDYICDKKILDIGCGPGVDILFLLQNNGVHGIDISDNALDIAKKQGFKYTYKLDISEIDRLPFPDNFRNVVLAIDILEHLFSPKDLLLEINRVLKPDGIAIISVPNHFYWNMRIRILKGKGIILPFHKSNEWDYFHIRFFTLQSFEKLIKQTRFTIQERFYEKFINCPRGLPHFIDKYFARRFPNLFSMHFIVKVTRKDKL